MLVEANEAAARSPLSHGTISEGCSVISFRSDGSGATQISGTAPIEIRTVRCGVAAPSKAELEKLLGRKLGGFGGMTYASSKPKKPLPPCRPVLKDPGDGEYALCEITHPELKSCSSTDVSENGLILGLGYHTGSGGAPAPWLSEGGSEPNICGFLGHPGGVTDEGLIGATANTTDDRQRAIRWSGDTGEELALYLGKDSEARAISTDGIIVGSVCIDADDRGQPNFRPAAWLPDGTLRVLEDFGCDWGQAVAVVERNVLIWGHRGWDPVALIWSLDHEEACIVGEKPGVNGNGLTRDGTVVGAARDSNGLSVSFAGRVGEPWRLLGTPPGASASAVNDAGDVVGSTEVEGFARPWLRRASGEFIWLPYFENHWCKPCAITSSGLIAGSAQADHGHHALLWTPASWAFALSRDD